MGIFLASAGALRLLACLPSRRWRARFPCRPSKNEHAESKDFGVEPRSLRSDQVLSKWRASERLAPSPSGERTGALAGRRIGAGPRWGFPASPGPSPQSCPRRGRKQSGLPLALGLLDLPEFQLD